MENAHPPNFKNQKLEILESKMNFPPKIKFGGYGWKAAGLEQLKIIANPVKYIVPGIWGRDMEKGKFAKQMNQ